MLSQLAEVGYSPTDITHLAFSHYHYDHTANANVFAGSTWLVRQVERDAMFAEKPPGSAAIDVFGAEEQQDDIINSDDHDVFGDGTVVIKLRQGNAGPSGAIRQTAEDRRRRAVRGFVPFPGSAQAQARDDVRFRQAQTPWRGRRSRTFSENRCAMWIQHDYIGNARLKKAPDYYE